MKLKFRYICTLLSVVFASTVLVSCQDMLDTDSDRLAFEEDHTISSPNDSVYSVMGILSQMQRIGERYVIFGELRGDLMTASEYASADLKDINNFKISADNAYKAKYDYYSIINNCNYAISRMDTSIVLNNGKAMMPEFVAIKAIRAWTYMQMAQAFGKVAYIEKPILSLEESLKEYPEIDMDALANQLITDLIPYVGVRHLDYGSIDDQASARFFIPIRMLLGDLFLYLNQYEMAAQMYHDQLYTYLLYPTNMYVSRWLTSVQSTYDYNHVSSYSGEVLTKIPYSQKPKDFHTNLIKLTYSNTPSLLPVQGFIDKMSRSMHFFALDENSNISAYLEGDLRGTIVPKLSPERADAYEISNKSKANTPLITRFLYATSGGNSAKDPDPDPLLPNAPLVTSVSIYSMQQVFLRYAEAVNRAGKPTLAFAVLKHGLNTKNLADPTKVNPSEIANKETYIDFSLYSDAFEENIGTAARGRGYGISKDVTYFVIPNFTGSSTARQDSINWVESAILDEMAAETAFNGNRFFDLLRMSRRRANHPEFMADKVAAKYSDPAEMKARLKNMDSWYIK